MRKCYVCKEELTTSNASPSTILGKGGKCRKCDAKIHKKIRDAGYVSPNQKLVDRRRALKYKYNISLEDYENKLKEQNDRCAICLNTINDTHKLGGVDHNHITGKFRGILCDNCNLMIGHSKDNIETLKKAIIYLSDGQVV